MPGELRGDVSDSRGLSCCLCFCDVVGALRNFLCLELHGPLNFVILSLDSLTRRTIIIHIRVQARSRGGRLSWTLKKKLAQEEIKIYIYPQIKNYHQCRDADTSMSDLLLGSCRSCSIAEVHSHEVTFRDGLSEKNVLWNIQQQSSAESSICRMRL